MSLLRSLCLIRCPRNSPQFMEMEDLLSLLQDPATCPDPEIIQSSPVQSIPVQLSPCLLSYFLKIHFNVVLSMLTSSVFSLSLIFLNKSPVYTPFLLVRATCLASHILLDLITRIIIAYLVRIIDHAACHFRSCSLSL